MFVSFAVFALCVCVCVCVCVCNHIYVGLGGLANVYAQNLMLYTLLYNVMFYV